MINGHGDESCISNWADDLAGGCFHLNFDNVSSLNGASLSSELRILIAPFMSKSFTFASILFANDCALFFGGA